MIGTRSASMASEILYALQRIAEDLRTPDASLVTEVWPNRGDHLRDLVQLAVRVRNQRDAHGNACPEECICRLVWWQLHRNNADMRLWQTLETMFVPQVTWGSFPLRGIGITSQREGTFERYISGMTRRPIVRSLGGNVLKGFRVELDYAHETLYLSAR